MAASGQNPVLMSDIGPGVGEMISEQRVEQRTSPYQRPAPHPQSIPALITPTKNVQPLNYGYPHAPYGSQPPQRRQPAPNQGQSRLIDVDMHPVEISADHRALSPKDAPLKDQPALDPRPRQPSVASLLSPPVHPPASDCPPQLQSHLNPFVKPYVDNYTHGLRLDFEYLWNQRIMGIEFVMSNLHQDTVKATQQLCAAQHKDLTMRLNEELDRAKKDRARLARENETLRKDRDDLLREREGLRTDKMRLEMDNSLLRSDRDGLKVLVGTIKAEMHASFEESSRLKSQNDTLRADIVKMRNELEVAVKEVERRKKVEEELQAEVDQRKMLEEKLVQVIKQYDELKNIICSHPDEMEIESDSDSEALASQLQKVTSPEDMEIASDSDTEPSTLVGSPPAPSRVVKEELAESTVLPISPTIPAPLPAEESITKPAPLVSPPLVVETQLSLQSPPPVEESSAKPAPPVSPPPVVETRLGPVDPPRRPSTPSERRPTPLAQAPPAGDLRRSATDLPRVSPESSPRAPPRCSAAVDPKRTSRSPTTPRLDPRRSPTDSPQAPIPPSLPLEERLRSAPLSPATSGPTRSSYTPPVPILPPLPQVEQSPPTVDPRRRPSAGPQTSPQVTPGHSPTLDPRKRPDSQSRSPPILQASSSELLISESRVFPASAPPTMYRKQSMGSFKHELPPRPPPQTHLSSQLDSNYYRGASGPSEFPAIQPMGTHSNAIPLSNNRKRSWSTFEADREREPLRATNGPPLSVSVQPPTGPRKSAPSPISPPVSRTGSLRFQHQDLLYVTNENEDKLVCKICLEKKTVAPCTFSRQHATWPALTGHYTQHHADEYAKLDRKSPSELIELLERQRKAQGSSAPPKAPKRAKV